VVDVTDGADVNVRLCAIEFCCHVICLVLWLVARGPQVSGRSVKSQR
jgi:hypothetical protein